LSIILSKQWADWTGAHMVSAYIVWWSHLISRKPLVTDLQ